MDIYSFKKINKNYSDDIIEIWSSALPNNIYAIFGRDIIKIYINKYFSKSDSLAIGAFKKNKLIGFVMYGQDNEINSFIIKKHFFLILKKTIFSIIRDKRNLFFLLNVFIFFIFFNKSFCDKRSIELLIICILPNFSNIGIGTELLSYSNKFIKKKYKSIYVKTLSKEQQNINFYKKNNYEIINLEFGRVYLKKQF